MANEKWNCNQICRWNDPSYGCIKPTYATCPMANTEPDASGWGQVNEKRLIYANALKRFTCETCNAIYGDEPCEPCDCRCMAVIDEQPTVDAVEVVRCVNCRSLNMTGYDEDNAHITDPLLQSGFCEMWGKDTQLCNFCSYGERRTDG